MGMTNEQFYAYQRRMLRQLERFIKAMPEGEEKKEFQQLIEDMKEELQK